jgi:hypothetical protein
MLNRTQGIREALDRFPKGEDKEASSPCKVCSVCSLRCDDYL